MKNCATLILKMMNQKDRVNNSERKNTSSIYL